MVVVEDDNDVLVSAKSLVSVPFLEVSVADSDDEDDIDDDVDDDGTLDCPCCLLENEYPSTYNPGEDVIIIPADTTSAAIKVLGRATVLVVVLIFSFSRDRDAIDLRSTSSYVVV